MTSSQYLSRTELAERLGTTPQHLAKLALTGEGPPYIKLGKYCRYPIRKLTEWETGKLQTSTSSSNFLNGDNHG